MFRIEIYLAALEIAGLMGFITTSSYQSVASFRFVPLLIALMVAGYIVFSKARNLSTREIIWVSVIASAILALIVQFLGFTVYPGLAKDMEFLSGENVTRVGLMLLIGIVGHLLLLKLLQVLKDGNRTRKAH